MVGFLVVLLASCGGQQSILIPTAPEIRVSKELAPQQVLNRHLESDPRTLDPSLATDVMGTIVIDDLFEGLTTVDASAEIVPGVATSWETSPDGRTWTFHLRSNARWSNGEPVTAKDFVYAWRRQVDPATASEYAQVVEPIENAAEITSGKMPPERLGVEAPDPRTVIVHLNAPTPYLLALVTNAYLKPLYEPAIKQWGDAWTQAGHMVSNGAYKLAERVINGRIRLVKNPNYWDASNVRLSEVTYFPIDDRSAATDQYLAGNLDITNRFNESEKERLDALLGNQVAIAPLFATAYLSFNETMHPFDGNPKLRQALSMAVDREILVKYVQHGVGVPAYNVMPPLPGYERAIPEWASLSADARHELARKLYREAGYSDGHPLETVLTYQSGDPYTRRVFEALSAMWQMNLGAHVQLYDLEWKVLLARRQLKQLAFYWDAWVGDYPDPSTFLQLFQTGNGMNTCGYGNPEYDRLVDEAASINDNTRRFELFHSAEEILNADPPSVPLYYYVSTHLIKPYVQGWKSNVMDRHLSQYLYVLGHEES